MQSYCDDETLFLMKYKMYPSKKLWEILTLNYWKAVVKSSKSDSGLYDVYGANWVMYKSDWFLYDGDSIIVWRKWSAGAINKVSGRFWASDVTYYVTTEQNIDYIFFALSLLNLPKLATWVKPGINRNEVYNLEIPLPPLSTQLNIVARLDSAMIEIDALRTETESALVSTRELWESTLERMFLSGGKNWEEKRLGVIATFRNGMNFTKGSKGENIKIVGVRDFKNRFFVPFETLESVVIDGKLSENDFLKENDILTVRSNGNPELIWRTLLAWEVIEKTSHSWFTIRIRLNEWILSPIYLCHFLKTKKSRMELISSGTGINIKSLNQWALSSLVIPFPKSLSEQSCIVAHLDTVRAVTERLEILYTEKLKSLDELRKSVLQEAFS